MKETDLKIEKTELKSYILHYQANDTALWTDNATAHGTCQTRRHKGLGHAAREAQRSQYSIYNIAVLYI